MFIYYTDHHEVDEDLRAIAIAHAGMYQDVAAGQMVRDLYYVSDTVSDKVASEKKINRPIRRRAYTVWINRYYHPEGHLLLSALDPI